MSFSLKKTYINLHENALVEFLLKFYACILLQTSIHGSIPERDFKSNNLNDPNKLEAGKEVPLASCSLIEDAASEAPTETLPTYKICGLIEPKGCLKDRNDYSLYIFSQTNM